MCAVLDIFNKWWNVLHQTNNGIVLRFSDADPHIDFVLSTGYSRIVSRKNGQQQVFSWDGGELEDLDILADAGTDVVIYGRISRLSLNDIDVDYMNTTGCPDLQSISLSVDGELSYINLSQNKRLTYASLLVSGLKSLDLGAIGVSEFNIQTSTPIDSIRYVANNEDVATALWSVIINSTAATGTVHLMDGAAYNSPIVTAATNKGWTIRYDL